MNRAKLKGILAILGTIVFWYLMIALVVAAVLFVWIGVQPSGPGCEFFCSPGFGIFDLILSISGGLFWPVMLVILIMSGGRL